MDIVTESMADCAAWRNLASASSTGGAAVWRNEGPGTKGVPPGRGWKEKIGKVGKNLLHCAWILIFLGCWVPWTLFGIHPAKGRIYDVLLMVFEHERLRTNVSFQCDTTSTEEKAGMSATTSEERFCNQCFAFMNAKKRWYWRVFQKIEDRDVSETL